jgi:hypothetical protein
MHKGYLYRIAVTSSDVLFVELGHGRKYTTAPVYNSGGVLGGIAAAEAAQKQEMQNRDIEEEGEKLDDRNAEALRIYIKAGKRGFKARPEELERVRIDYANSGKWYRFSSGEESPP